MFESEVFIGKFCLVLKNKTTTKYSSVEERKLFSSQRDELTVFSGFMVGQSLVLRWETSKLCSFSFTVVSCPTLFQEAWTVRASPFF